MEDAKQLTQTPISVGSSILGVKYKDGILIACDTLVGAGKTRKHTRMQRMATIGKDTLITASGELSDLQHVIELLSDIDNKDKIFDDGAQHTASALHSYVTRVLYRHRNKMDPLWGTFVVAGKEADGSFFLGSADLWGTAIRNEPFVATAIAGAFVVPHLRNEVRPDMTEAEARALLVKGFKITTSVDLMTSEEIQFAKVTKDGVFIEEPVIIKPDWSRAKMLESRMDLPLCAYPY